MTDFATALESYLPESKKEKNSYLTIVRTPNQYDKVQKDLPEDCVIYCRTLDGKPCASTKCVGYCWSKVHKGFITKNLMTQHQCLEKNCTSFQKLPDAPYWINKEAQSKARKTGKRLKKQIAAEEAEFLKQMRDLTIHDFNFYAVAVELKNDTYEVRIINFTTIDYAHYLDLFLAIADNRKIHFTKIKADEERKRLIIETNNIIKIPAEPEKFNLIVFIREKLTSALHRIKALFTRVENKK